MGNISSPGYPNTPYRPEDQHDDNIRCHWRLRPPTGSYMMVTLKNFFPGRREWNYCRSVYVHVKPSSMSLEENVPEYDTWSISILSKLLRITFIRQPFRHDSTVL